VEGVDGDATIAVIDPYTAAPARYV
jgi:hypothetical protein